MKFTATPKDILNQLNQVSKGLPKRKREKMQVTFSAARNRVFVSGNGMIAGLSTKVSCQGQFQINWKKITALLDTYHPKTPLQIECAASGLKIGSFCTTIENYQSKPVPAEQPIPPTIPLKQSIKKKEKPQVTASPDGYSPPPPCRSDSDCTGMRGMVDAEDFSGSRQPVICPGCHYVGYNAKDFIRGRIYYERRRTWVSPHDALDCVVLTGEEESVLCPNCLEMRLHKGNPIPGRQSDLFEKRSFIKTTTHKDFQGNIGDACVPHSTIDPEIITVGAELTSLYIEGGVKTFKQYAAVMKQELGDIWDNLKKSLHELWTVSATENPDIDEVTRSQAADIIADIDKQAEEADNNN